MIAKILIIEIFLRIKLRNGKLKIVLAVPAKIYINNIGYVWERTEKAWNIQEEYSSSILGIMAVDC